MYILSYSQRLYTRIFHQILFVPWLVHQDTIVYLGVFTNILYTRSSSDICHTLTHLSGSNPNIVWVITWLIRQNPLQIFFESYPDSFVKIQCNFSLRIDSIFYLKALPSICNWTLLTRPKRIVKIVSYKTWSGSA